MPGSGTTLGTCPGTFPGFQLKASVLCWHRKENAMGDALRLIEHCLADWRVGWSMGSFGPIAEFHRDENEPGRAEAGDRLSDVRPIEALSPKPHRWSHGITLCLPKHLARR